MKILELTFDNFRERVHAKYQIGESHAARIYRGIFQNSAACLNNTANFSVPLQFVRLIRSDLESTFGEMIAEETDGESTKFITCLQDGHKIESVVIPMATHNTICVSSQVGCKMGCRFCQTGQMGFHRNLTVEEIVGQVYTAKFKLNREVRNIVFMGMGEPLDNFNNVIQAVRVLNDQRGFDIALRYITISTVGQKMKLEKLAHLGMKGLRLSISLNAPNDRIRSHIMPANHIGTMKTLQDTLAQFPFSKKETVFITYVLIKNINDAHEHALELADYIKPIPAKVNVIPYNPRSSSPFASPSKTDVRQFCDWLVDCGVFIRQRRTRGQDMMAACGQLGKLAES